MATASSMAKALISSSLFAPKPTLSSVHFPSKSLRLLFPLKKSLSFGPLVAKAYGFARQEQGTGLDLKEDQGFDWLEGEDLTRNEEDVISSEEAKLYVGNLPYEIDSENLAQLFGKAGVVEVAEVIYNRETDQSRGFGFVTMSTVEEAEKAIEMFHRYEVNGRLLTVNIATPKGGRVERTFQPSIRVYVGNLPWQVDDSRLEQVFSEYGKVLDAKVVYDRESGRSRGFGFVRMSSKSEMDDAIAALDGQSLDGRAWRVNVAEDRPRRAAF